MLVNALTNFNNEHYICYSFYSSWLILIKDYQFMLAQIH